MSVHIVTLDIQALTPSSHALDTDTFRAMTHRAGRLAGRGSKLASGVESGFHGKSDLQGFWSLKCIFPFFSAYLGARRRGGGGGKGEVYLYSMNIVEEGLGLRLDTYIYVYACTYVYVDLFACKYAALKEASEDSDHAWTRTYI